MSTFIRSIRLVSASLVAFASACAGPTAEEVVAEGEVALSDCAPGDTACDDAPCASDDGTCPPPSPCDPSDTACEKPDPCADGDEGCAGSTSGGGVDVCSSLAAELATLLPHARACSIASVPAKAPCSAIVPTLPAGCATAADPANEETEKYLEVWKTYVQACPLADQPCPNTDGFVGACAQGPDVDGLTGVCELVKPAVPADGAAD